MNKLCRVLVLAGVLAGIAQPAKADVGQHWAFRLVPLESDGVVTDASLDLVGCFATYEAALEAGIGQGVDVGVAVTPESLTDEALESPTITASVLIGTELRRQRVRGELQQLLRLFHMHLEHHMAGGQCRCRVERPIPIGRGVRRL